MKREEEYIISESREINVSRRTAWTKHIKHAFPALKHRNYRLYAMSNVVSQVGSWLQNVAQGYMVYEITRSAFWVGLVSALYFIPILFFSLFAGVLIDKHSKRGILYITQSAQAILALALGILVLMGNVEAVHIAIFAFLLGCANALDMPARQTFMLLIVRREDLSSAISLNAGSFNAARIIGPSMAGIAIAQLGIGGAFIINALSFIAVLYALYSMRFHEVIHDTHPNPLRAIKEGLSASFRHAVIRPLLIMASLAAIFGWSYVAIMPVIAKDVFHQGAQGLGYLQAAAGFGAVMGAIVVSSQARRIKPYVFIFSGVGIFSAALMVFSFMTQMVGGMIALAVAGFGLIMMFSTINATIQHLSPEHLRGRIMSVYTLMFIGMSPFGSLEVGLLGDVVSVANTLRLNAIILLIGVSVLFVTQKQLRHVK